MSSGCEGDTGDTLGLLKSSQVGIAGLLWTTRCCVLEAIVTVAFSSAGSKSKGQQILKKFPQLAKRKGAINFSSRLWTTSLVPADGKFGSTDIEF